MKSEQAPAGTHEGPVTAGDRGGGGVDQGRRVLLISAFVVIPACAGRLLSRRFHVYVLVSVGLGGGCALLGLLASGLTNLPSGPSVVMVQFIGFLVALLISRSPRAQPIPIESR